MENKVTPAYKSENFRKDRPGKVLNLARFLGMKLNVIHGVNYSDRYWLHILKSYVVFCVNTEPYMSSEMKTFSIPVTPKNKWKPLNKRDCLKHELLRKIRAIKGIGRGKNLSTVLKNNNDIAYGTRGKIIAKQLNIAYVQFPDLPFLLKNSKKRRVVNDSASSIQDTFIKNAFINLPKIYVEYYDFINNYFQDDVKYAGKTFHREHGAGLITEFFVARSIENGAKLYEYQFGGHTGETMQSVDEMRYLTIDKRMTYGWKVHEKDEPFFALRCEEFKSDYQAAHTKSTRDITIVYNAIATPEAKQRYLKLTSYFHDNLDMEKYRKIHLRPRGNSRLFNSSKNLRFLSHLDFFLIDSGKKPISKIVRKSRIMIHWDIPSTNLLECCYVDHPVVGILTNPDPTEIVKPHYDFLLKIGILHQNIESLTRHLNRVQIENWWQSVIKMKGYQDFKNTFLRQLQ